jgi:hypothetical protein
VFVVVVGVVPATAVGLEDHALCGEREVEELLVEAHQFVVAVEGGAGEADRLVLGVLGEGRQDAGTVMRGFGREVPREYVVHHCGWGRVLGLGGDHRVLRSGSVPEDVGQAEKAISSSWMPSGSWKVRSEIGIPSMA